MANVLDITQHLPERPALDVEFQLQLLKRLLQVGQISRHAFGIGALVLANMQRDGAYNTSLTREDLVDAAISVDNEPLVCIGEMEIHELAWALQALQSHCGLWNHYQEHRVGKGTDRVNHFTDKHYGNGDFAGLYKVLKYDTPIYFEWKPEDVESVVAIARESISTRMRAARWVDISNVRLP